jgi:hypothetical protein
MGKLAWRAALLVLLIGVAGCGADTQSARPSEGAAAHGPSTATAAQSQPPAKVRKKPKPSRDHRQVTVVRSSPSPTANAAPPAFVSCDANIRVRAATTTCPFAENVFYELFQATAGYISATTVRAWSPATRRFYSVKCSGGTSIVCTAGDGGEVHFSSDAMDAYDDSQANRYASTHDTGPSDVSDKDLNSPTPDGSDVSTDTDTADFCDVHDCIPNYDEGTGSQVQCADGTWSHSGGRPGACSWHGGVG